MTRNEREDCNVFLFPDSAAVRSLGCLALATLCAAPCVAQSIQQPPSPATPATSLLSPSNNLPPPSPSLNDGLPAGLPNTPRLDGFPPQIAAWVRMRGAGLARDGEIPNADDMPAYVHKTGGGLFKNPGSSNDDIMAIAFLVMLEAAKSAREDLKSIIDKVKEINEAKARLRRQLDALRSALDDSAAKGVAPCLLADCNAAANALAHAAGLRGETSGYPLPVAPAKADLDAMLELLRKQEGEVSEMGQMESLRLQMAMDRLSKIMSTLSNLLKKASETASGITSNLK